MENLHFIAKRERDVSVLICMDGRVCAQRMVEGNLRKFLLYMTADTQMSEWTEEPGTCTL